MNKICFVLLLLFSFTAITAQSIEGIWWNTEKTGKIKIVQLDNQTFQGQLISADDAHDEDGNLKLNTKDRDAEKRNQPIVGLILMNGFTTKDQVTYNGGTIYDPENGKTYKCKLTLTSKNEMDVRGYIGIPAFGRTEHWTRVEE